jgi:hypothetical protein
VITWITNPRIPGFDPNFPHDALLLADDAWLPAARAAGWPAARLGAAPWPTLSLPPSADRRLVLLADTRTLETPITELDLSSHHVLWEQIRNDLAHDPFSLGGDADGFLTRRMTALGISDQGLDRARFIDQLILPAYQQGLASILLRAGLPLKLYGEGWDQLPSLRSACEGPVGSRGAFVNAASSATAIVYPWPLRYQGPVDVLSRPVLWTASRNPEKWIIEARRLLSAIPRPSERPLSGFRAEIDSLLQ